MNIVERERAHMKSGPVACKIEDFPVYLMPKVFKTGSVGWHGQGKIPLNDTPCQFNIVITVIGSKPSVGPTPAANSKPKRERKATAPKNVQDSPGEHPSANTGLELPPEQSPLFGG